MAPSCPLGKLHQTLLHRLVVEMIEPQGAVDQALPRKHIQG
jgi:hypothetical protein